MKIEIPEFASKIQLFNYLQKNKERLINLKKSEIKRADDVECLPVITDDKGMTLKAESEEVDLEDSDVIMREVIINTTNLIDSHLDLHIPKMWNKSLKETSYHLHLQEHNNSFKGIIADGTDVHAFVKTYTWKELKAKYPGETEGLTFRSRITKERNEYMFEQYAKKRVRNHSVGMRYGKLVMCIGNKDYGAEFEAWEKYLPMAVNPEVAEEKGYFWAVPEGKVIEGSAVVRGSNWVTPTLDNVKGESRETTLEIDEPRKALIDYDSLIKNFSL